FGINGVVIPPVGYRSHSNSGFENICTFGQRQSGHITTITPAENSNSGSINIGLFPKPLGGSNLVFDLIFSQLHIGYFFEFCSFSACSSSVNTSYNVSLLYQMAEPQSVAAVP